MQARMPDRVVARTGCRIDLAGGTLDIWPLGLLHPGARTVNVAIDLEVKVELMRRDAGYVVRLGDSEHRAEGLNELLEGSDTALFAVIAQAVELPPVEACLSSSSPRGGGLGASSAIGAALIAASERLLGRTERSALERAVLGRDLEARLMGLPTGLQDHLPPLLGGALEIIYQPGGDRVRRLDADLERLARSLTIVYTGRSHLSGETNWQVVRRRLDGDERTNELFSRICEVSIAMVSALEAGDLKRVGGLVSNEWSCRRQLADGVSTPEIERILAVAQAAGAWGGKAGGAGGGGCVALMHPEDLREAVEHAVEEAGGKTVATRPTAEGLKIEEG